MKIEEMDKETEEMLYFDLVPMLEPTENIGIILKGIREGRINKDDIRRLLYHLGQGRRFKVKDIITKLM